MSCHIESNKCTTSSNTEPYLPTIVRKFYVMRIKIFFTLSADRVANVRNEVNMFVRVQQVLVRIKGVYSLVLGLYKYTASIQLI